MQEGYLTKSKLAKGLLKSTKLRFFVLKQNPVTSEARLEYYEGMLCRGTTSLRGADVRPARKPGTFTLRTWRAKGDLARTMTLQTEDGTIEGATAWILALQKAAYAFRQAQGPEVAAAESTRGAVAKDADGAPTAAMDSLALEGEGAEGGCGWEEGKRA